MNQQGTPTDAGNFISTKEASRLLRKHPKTLDRWRQEGRGPRWYQPEGPPRGRVLYLEHEVIAYALGQGGAA